MTANQAQAARASQDFNVPFVSKQTHRFRPILNNGTLFCRRTLGHVSKWRVDAPIRLEIDEGVGVETKSLHILCGISVRAVNWHKHLYNV